MTAKTPERIRREAARECAEQLAVVVTECTWDASMSWLQLHLRDGTFNAEELALVLASMTEAQQEYREVIKERSYPTGGR